MSRGCLLHIGQIEPSELTPSLRFVLDLLSNFFLQLCSSWRDFGWHSTWCGPSVVAELVVQWQDFKQSQRRVARGLASSVILRCVWDDTTTWSEQQQQQQQGRTRASLLCVSRSIRLGVSVSVHCDEADVVTVTGALLRGGGHPHHATVLLGRLSQPLQPRAGGPAGVGDKHRLMKINAGSSCFTAVDRRRRTDGRSGGAPRRGTSAQRRRLRRRPSIHEFRRTPRRRISSNLRRSLARSPPTSYHGFH